MENLAQIHIGDAFYQDAPHFLKSLTGISSLVTFIISLSFVLAGIAVLIIALIGGFQVITGAGSGSPESAAKGKKAVTSAILGFIIIFVAYWIIRFLEVITGVEFVTSPTF